jgi:hypothetical protein
LIKTREFNRDACKEGLTDEALCQAVAEIEAGLVDPRLGGFLLKKRVTKGNSGKSGGFRTILAHRQGDRVFFLFVFSKGEMNNISSKERTALLEAGDVLMSFAPAKLDALIAAGNLVEVVCSG